MAPWCAVFLLVFLANGFVDDLEPARETWPDDEYGSAPVRKHSYCGLASTNVSSISSALAGRNVSVLFVGHPYGESFFEFVNFNQSSGILSSGYFVEIMDKMAMHGGFEWRNSFAVVEHGVDEYEDFLVWAVKHYDLVVDWVTMNEDRVGKGINFLYTFMDTSLSLVIQPHAAEPHWYSVWFSFLRPFDGQVWVVLLIVACVTAGIYMHIERGQDDFQSNDKGMYNAYGHSLYLTFATFTGACNFSPSTEVGKFYSFAFSFLILLVVSAYTANLASLLVVHGSIEGDVHSLEEAAVKGVPVCNFYKALEPEMSHVSGLKVVRTHHPLETFEEVRKGRCAAGTARHFIWRAAENTVLANPSCSLAELPKRVTDLRSGFVAQVDGYENCTDLAAQVFNVILLHMANERFFQKVSKKYFIKSSTNPCPPGGPVVPATTSASLGLSHLSGIFIMYGIASSIAMAFHSKGSFRKASASEDSSEDDSQETELPGLNGKGARMLSHEGIRAR